MPADEHSIDWRQETREFREAVRTLSAPASGLLAELSAMEALPVLRAELPVLDASPFACIPDLQGGSRSTMRSARRISLPPQKRSIADGKVSGKGPGQSGSMASPTLGDTAVPAADSKQEATPPVFSLRQRDHQIASERGSSHGRSLDATAGPDRHQPVGNVDGDETGLPVTGDGARSLRNGVRGDMDLPAQVSSDQPEDACGIELLGQLVNSVDSDASGASRYDRSARSSAPQLADNVRLGGGVPEDSAPGSRRSSPTHPAQLPPIAGDPQGLPGGYPMQPGLVPEPAVADPILPILSHHGVNDLPAGGGNTAPQDPADSVGIQYADRILRSSEYPASASALSDAMPSAVQLEGVVAEFRQTDAAGLADLVNDALIDQARRHGVDLS